MKFSLLIAGALAATMAMSAGARAQTTALYNATTLPTTAETGVVNYLQDLTLAQGAGTYSIDSLQLGINFGAGDEDDYGVILDFYTGVNTSPTAADALATATDVDEVAATLQDPSSSGNFTYTFTLNSPVTFSTSDGTLGVQVQLTDAEFDSYSDDENARFSTVAPTVGGAPGFVWTDANGDGVFSGAEQTTFGLTAAYTRLSLTGVAPAAVVSAAPEPASWVLMIGGLGLVGCVLRRARGRSALFV